MSESKETEKIDWIKIFNAVTLFLCFLCLAFIAFSLGPVAQWADNQNICVEQETAKSQTPISWGVRKCNGRSKVYQVKSN